MDGRSAMLHKLSVLSSAGKQREKNASSFPGCCVIGMPDRVRATLSESCFAGCGESLGCHGNTILCNK